MGVNATCTLTFNKFEPFPCLNRDVAANLPELLGERLQTAVHRGRGDLRPQSCQALSVAVLYDAQTERSLNELYASMCAGTTRGIIQAPLVAHQ